MEEKLLKKEDKIFSNLYNEFGWEIDNSIKREDWKAVSYTHLTLPTICSV